MPRCVPDKIGESDRRREREASLEAVEVEEKLGLFDELGEWEAVKEEVGVASAAVGVGELEVVVEEDTVEVDEGVVVSEGVSVDMMSVPVMVAVGVDPPGLPPSASQPVGV